MFLYIFKIRNIRHSNSDSNAKHSKIEIVT